MSGFAIVPRPGHTGMLRGTEFSGIAPYCANTAGGRELSAGEFRRKMDERLALLGPWRVIVGMPGEGGSEGVGVLSWAVTALFTST